MTGICGVCYGQSSPQGSPLGGRTLLTGSTGVTLGQDGAAPFVNPATISRIADRRIAMSVNAYRFTVRRVPDWYQPGEADTETLGDLQVSEPELTERKFRTLPSTFCIFITLRKVLGEETYERFVRSVLGTPGRLKFAFCGATNERQEFGFNADSVASGETTLAHAVDRSFSRFGAGPTISYQWTDRLTLGGSLHVTGSRLRQSTSVNLVNSAGDAPTRAQYQQHLSALSFDLTAILGFTYRLSPWVFGASVRTPSLHIRHSMSASRNRSLDFAGSQQLDAADGTFRAAPIPRLSLGVGLELERLRTEFNVHVFPSIDDVLEAELSVDENFGDAALDQESSMRLKEASRWTVAMGVGGERFLSSDFSVVGGVNADFGLFDEVRTDNAVSSLVQNTTNQVGLSLGIGTYGPSTELLIGTRFALEWGRLAAPNVLVTPTRLESISKTGASVLLVLAGSVSWRNLTRAVRDLDQIPNALPGR